ncbi:MAG: Antibiotic biosynthesis monooxygenase [Acidobacteria bacterium]|nr:Antibiotic biosynthesis monooxygenase [Acidobacteriota bacterium]
MYARVTIVHMAPGKVNDATELYHSSVVPAVQQREGYRGIFLLGDRQTGKSLSITLWDTEANLMAGESGFHQAQVDKFKGLYTTPPEKELYEVLVHAEAPK